MRAVKKLAQGHRAAVAQSRDSNLLLAPQPAELAPSGEPECKRQSWQEGGLPPLQIFPPFIDLSSHSFFPRISPEISKFHLEAIIFTATDKATERRKVRDRSLLLLLRKGALSTSNQLGGTRTLMHLPQGSSLGAHPGPGHRNGSQGQPALHYGTGTRDGHKVGIKDGVRVTLGLGLTAHFPSGLWTQLGSGGGVGLKPGTRSVVLG